MCGLAGLINIPSKYGVLPYADDVLRDLTYYNRLRGTDAFGMAKVQFGWGHEVLKDEGDPGNLWYRKDFKDFSNWSEHNRYFMLHNRSATVGPKNQSAAHPYLKAKTNSEDPAVIILAHNGTLTHIESSLDKAFPGKTDSEQVARMIAAGMSLEELDSVIWGAYAFVWYDSEDGSMNFIRNDQRPFAFVMVKDGIFFGSEVYTVAGAVDRRAPTGSITKLLRAKPMIHYKYNPDDGILSETPIKHKTKSYSGNGAYGQYSQYGRFPDQYTVPEKFIKEKEQEAKKAIEVADTSAGPTASNDEVAEASIDLTGGNVSGDKCSTNVVPFRGDDPSKNVPLAPLIQPVFGRQRPHRNWKPSTKKKYSQVKEAKGYEAGDTVVFALTDYTFARDGRRTQVKLDGLVCSWDEKAHRWLMVPAILIEGQVGMSIEQVDFLDCLWEGVITNIGKCNNTTGTLEEYKFSLRDIKPQEDIPDPFQLVAPLQHPAPAVVKEAAAPVVPTEEHPLTESKGYEATSTDSLDKRSVQCDDCGGWFDKKYMHSTQHSKNALSGKLTLYFCGGCWTAQLMDSKLDRIFEERMRELSHTTNTLLRSEDPHYIPEERIVH